jgi:Calpain family cysteine protease
MFFNSTDNTLNIATDSNITSNSSIYNDLAVIDETNLLNILNNFIAHSSFNPILESLNDQKIVNQTRDLAADGELSRNDMIAIFRNTKDDNVIDANELQDLRMIVDNASSFNMQDYVRVLSNKIVNGDYANANYQDNSLGNLFAGSSSEHMETLVQKWFFGSDTPSLSSNSTYTYEKVNGELFQNGISYQDTKQGRLGDCYFIAGLAEVAFNSPSTIESMFTDNGDDTYTVRFYNQGTADYITVNKFLPVDQSGNLVYASLGTYYENSDNELWVALAEKAYAQINESGWIDNTNSYLGVESGWDKNVVNHITGISTASNYLNFESMVNAFNDGTLMGLSSYPSQVSNTEVVPNHAYAIVDYNAYTQEFTLYNPWGVDGGFFEDNFKPGLLTLSFDELQANFSEYSYLA